MNITSDGTKGHKLTIKFPIPWFLQSFYLLFSVLNLLGMNSAVCILTSYGFLQWSPSGAKRSFLNEE